MKRAAAVALALLVTAGSAGAQPAVGEMVLPVRPACVSSPFGNRPAPGPHAIGFHRGIDLPAAAGAAIYAVADGQVIGIHRRGPGGLELLIAHSGAAGRYVSVYAHLGAVAPVLAQGRTAVRAGERIGVVGRSGVIYGTHLYFELMVGGQPVDPAPYFPVSACVKTSQIHARGG
jgi:murein DD-endopeptidase MepM/ murein hydrolase activator NlpD